MTQELQNLDEQINPQKENKNWFSALTNNWFLSTKSKVILPGKDSWFVDPLNAAKIIHKARKRKKVDIKDITIQLTKDPELLQQYYDLREKLYREDSGYKSYSGAENYYDKNGRIFLAIYNKSVVAGARLVVSSDVDCLPHENLEENFTYKEISHNLNVNIDGVLYSEISALAIDRDFRGNLIDGLFATVVEHCRSNNIKYIFGISNMKCNRDYKIAFLKIGIECVIADKIVAPRKSEFNNIDSYPIVAKI